MSRILPDPLPSTFSSATFRVYRSFRGMSGDDPRVWARLPLPGAVSRPEFLVALEDSAFLIGVSEESQDRAEAAIQGALFQDEQDVSAFAATDWSRLREFLEACRRELAVDDKSVLGLLVFPNVDHDSLSALFGANPRGGIYFLGKEHLGSDSLLRCLRKLATRGCDSAVLARLRSLFTPECVVPARFNPHTRPVRNVEARATPLLLDVDQESWAKQRLSISAEGSRVVDAPADADEVGPVATLVTGVAGSGKSLVLLFRATTQAQLDRGSRSLFVTHNRALERELAGRSRELGSRGNIAWRTYLGWCYGQLGRTRAIPKPIAYSERQRVIEATARELWPQMPRGWGPFLRDEYDWMQDYDHVSLESYLAADRIGRRQGLGEERRRQVFKAYRLYRKALQHRNRDDWSGLALRLWRSVQEGRVKLPSYDYIYVDEAQFFAPVWLRTLRATLAPQTGRLFMAADPTQGFLKRRQSWAHCGLDMRGRSTRLRRAYRNARPILEFAGAFYRARLDDEDAADLNLPDAQELASASERGSVQIARVTSRQDEVTRVINELKALLSRGLPPSAILVLTAVGRETGDVAQRLRRAIGPEFISDARQSADGDRVRVCALDGATGLEATVVFLIGAGEILASEHDLSLTDDQRAELIRDNTRRLYMAFTRAGARLFVTWQGQPPHEIEKAGGIRC